MFPQITDALSYVHNKERLVHCSLGPHSILLNKKGGWKLFGFGFAEKIKDGKVRVEHGQVAQVSVVLRETGHTFLTSSTSMLVT